MFKCAKPCNMICITAQPIALDFFFKKQKSSGKHLILPCFQHLHPDHPSNICNNVTIRHSICPFSTRLPLDFHSIKTLIINLHTQSLDFSEKLPRPIFFSLKNINREQVRKSKKSSGRVVQILLHFCK